MNCVHTKEKSYDQSKEAYCFSYNPIGSSKPTHQYSNIYIYIIYHILYNSMPWYIVRYMYGNYNHTYKQQDYAHKVYNGIPYGIPYMPSAKYHCDNDIHKLSHTWWINTFDMVQKYNCDYNYSLFFHHKLMGEDLVHSNLSIHSLDNIHLIYIQTFF